MRNKFLRRSMFLLVGACMLAIAIGGIEARPRAAAAQSAGERLTVGAGEIGGVVTSAKGPEAGVWVIAETSDLPTKYRKIVVTDDLGRYMIPDLPKANYKVWVRGYGLVDSQPVSAAPGKTLALSAVVAPDARSAAQYYPADYWYSLMQLPPKSAFPMVITPKQGIAGMRPQRPATITESQWVYFLKRGCGSCHEQGNKFTREIPAALGHFDSSSAAWERRIASGQEAETMVSRVGLLGYDRTIAMFSDWTDRVAAGELPPVPARPAGVERNVVITLWDFGTLKSFVHDLISTDKRNPTENAYGPLIATEWAAGTIDGVDPVENTKFSIKIPAPQSATNYIQAHPPKMVQPSPYWGSEIVFDNTLNEEGAERDSKGRVWFIMDDKKDTPAFCKKGSNNPFAKNYPIEADWRDIEYYDSKAGTFGTVQTCFGGSHQVFDNDKDETLYVSAGDNHPNNIRFGIGWVKTRVWDHTHDSEKSQGWCPAVTDYNGDGKIGPYTRTGEPLDPKLDRLFPSYAYGLSVSPVDHSVWYASMEPEPGLIVRMTPGSNPPETCRTEVYEPPYQNRENARCRFLFPGRHRHRYRWRGVGGSDRHQLSRQPRPAQMQSVQRPDCDRAAMPRGLDAVSGAGPEVQGARRYWGGLLLLQLGRPV